MCVWALLLLLLASGAHTRAHLWRALAAARACCSRALRAYTCAQPRCCADWEESEALVAAGPKSAISPCHKLSVLPVRRS